MYTPPHLNVLFVCFVLFVVCFWFRFSSVWSVVSLAFMSIAKAIASIFRMTDEVWARHTNPWSVWTRFVTLGLIVLAVWYRHTLGSAVWYLLAVLAIWIWLNPRAFPKPATTDRWSSKAVLGERVWLNRKTIPIPVHFNRVIACLNTLSVAGMVLLIFGFVDHHPWMVGSGLALTYIGKMWFLDRMVWLYDTMKDADVTYSNWFY